MNKTTQPDDIDFITDDIVKVKRAAVSHRHFVSPSKHVKVQSSVQVAKDTFKEARALHKRQIKALKRSIVSHKLLIKQAKFTYKIIKQRS